MEGKKNRPKSFDAEIPIIDPPVDNHEAGELARQVVPPSTAPDNRGQALRSASDSGATTREGTTGRIPGQLPTNGATCTRSSSNSNGHVPAALPELTNPVVDYDTEGQQEARAIVVNVPPTNRVSPLAAQGGSAGHNSQVNVDTLNEPPDSSPEIDTEHPDGDDVEHVGHQPKSKRPENEGWNLRGILHICAETTL